MGVTYDTTHAQLSKIPELVKEIILSKEELEFDRGHFSGFGDFSLNFEFVYYVKNPEYNAYMDNQQAVYLAIFSVFESEGINFAFPTQTLFVNQVLKPNETESMQN